MTDSENTTKKSKKVKEPKPKPTPRLRRPDELFKTIFTRLTTRRQPFMYVGFGEADNEFVMGSVLEDDLLYGDTTFAQSLIRIHNPVLLEQLVDLLKNVGYVSPSLARRPYYLDVHDLGSFINKYKEVSDYPTEHDEEDRWWHMVKKKQKKEDGGKTVLEPKYIRENTVTQFRFDNVNHWRTLCCDVMDNAKTFWRVPYTNDDAAKTVLEKWDARVVCQSPIGEKHPLGLKTVLTRGKDFLETKFLERSKYDIDIADLVFWIESGSAVRMAHHVKVADFEMVTTRPFSVLF